MIPENLSKLKPYFLLVCFVLRSLSTRGPAPNILAAEHGDIGGGKRSWRLRHGKTLASPQGRKDLLGGIPSCFPGSALLKTFCSLQHWEECVLSTSPPGYLPVSLVRGAARLPWAITDYLCPLFVDPGTWI